MARVLLCRLDQGAWSSWRGIRATAGAGRQVSAGGILSGSSKVEKNTGAERGKPAGTVDTPSTLHSLPFHRIPKSCLVHLFQGIFVPDRASKAVLPSLTGV